MLAMQSRIIVLNGVGSVGKSSAAKALQKLAREPLLHVQGDAFLDMIAPRLWGDPEGIIFEQRDIGVGPQIEIKMGLRLDRLMDGMRRSVATLAKAGNSCIVDDVMLSAQDQRSYTDACAGIQLHFVGLRAPLDVLEQRERDRGDRVVGLARWQYARVHTGINYDFEIDTATRRSDQIAREIASALAISLIEG